ncbi:MAG: hypothetical protein IKU45_02745 [Clostridia bacterium]|nr:hypothetical protein [Clostridia bacterium]
MKEKKDRLYAIGHYDEQIGVRLPRWHRFKPTRENISKLFPDDIVTVLVKCSECGRIHNIKNPCECGKMTDVYVD